MSVEEMMALVRLSEHSETIVADLAKAMLSLVEQLRDANLRADLAEATLELELKKKEPPPRRPPFDGGAVSRAPGFSFRPHS